MLNIVKKTEATLSAETGRILAWFTDKEEGFISVAVPGDRAKMTPAQARAFGLWLIEASETTRTKPDPLNMRASAAARHEAVKRLEAELGRATFTPRPRW
ncbi:hypothetical protein ACFYZ4_15055 [Streptomyces sp. NPDC001513]|uniref:hypothetical protein n=1 Tax=Streptomyces sp. NPDC001513 TaxID=3364580 RepID=UPI0036787879